MGRAPCCDKANVKKGPWSPEEDAKLKSHIQTHGVAGNWIALPHKIGLKRCGKSCRLRWLNYLRPNIKHGGFTEEEDNLICTLFVTIGSRWSIIAAQLPGRTDNDIKNYWNTKLKKKLLAKQRRSDAAKKLLPPPPPPPTDHGQIIMPQLEANSCYYFNHGEASYYFQQHQNEWGSNSSMNINPSLQLQDQGVVLYDYDAMPQLNTAAAITSSSSSSMDQNVSWGDVNSLIYPQAEPAAAALANYQLWTLYDDPRSLLGFSQ